ncbi:MAG: hypothetical protein AB9903_34280 [Vulcanimicrobiota bacterium]
MEMYRRLGVHFEANNKCCQPMEAEIVNTLREALIKKALTPQQAADEIKITIPVLFRVLRGEAPKGARKVRAKIKAWLTAQI